ncbi:MAG: fused MFS/spermidine synthase, partial [Planctomycetota bacterium]|nr:fused MFS/spermidine synthase [Planctomycetota bacterium]
SYYDVFSLAPLYANANVTPPSPFKFWTLGHGAGSAMGPLLAGIQGNDWTGVGIELDPAVLELSPPPFWGAQLQIVSGDGRSLLRCAPNDLDLIILDAYSRQFEIPLHLATQEFFLDVSNHLRKGGIFAANLGSASLDEQEQPWLASLVSGLQLSFQDIRVHRVPFSRNIVLFARKDMDLLSLEELAKILPAGFPVSVGAACLPSQTQDFFPNALPFKDDLNPLALWQAQEWFQGARP